MTLTIYYSGLPTSFCYHLRLQSHTTKAWLHKHLGKVTVDQNRADSQPLHPTCHSSPHNKNTDTSWSTAVTVVLNPNNQFNIHLVKYNHPSNSLFFSSAFSEVEPLATHLQELPNQIDVNAHLHYRGRLNFPVE